MTSATPAMLAILKTHLVCRGSYQADSAGSIADSASCSSPKGVWWTATGWAESVGARTAMAGLYSAMDGRIRTPWQGADTAVYLALEVLRKSWNVGMYQPLREGEAKAVRTDEALSCFYLSNYHIALLRPRTLLAATSAGASKPWWSAFLLCRILQSWSLEATTWIASHRRSTFGVAAQPTRRRTRSSCGTHFPSLPACRHDRFPAGCTAALSQS